MNKEEYAIDEKTYENYDELKITIIFSNLGRRYKKIGDNGIRAMDDLKYNKKNISRKIRKIRRKLNKLYLEYKRLNITKTDSNKLNELIDNISKVEYKYIKYLKKQ